MTSKIQRHGSYASLQDDNQKTQALDYASLQDDKQKTKTQILRFASGGEAKDNDNSLAFLEAGRQGC
jgi:hypothetical protein